MPRCAISECTNEAGLPGSARGWCRAHYKRWRKRGDPLSPTPPRPIRDPLERWWEKVDRRGPDECWPWKASRDELGYGFFRLDAGPMHRAHRVGWELLNDQELPDDILVCHTCDNPPCCNPAHWFIGDNAANAADKAAKGRARCVPRHGEESPNARITAAQVAEIRRRYAASGVTQRVLGDEHGIGQTEISRIVRGARWAE